MQEFPHRVDALSETIALTTYGNTKNIIITAVEVLGPLDEQAVTLAVTRAVERYPQLMSCFTEIKVKGRYYLTWQHRADLPIPITITQLSTSELSQPILDVLLCHLESRLDRDWDLFREVAVEFHIFRLSEDHNLLVSVCHHAASDAGTATEFGKEVLAQYHEIMEGEKPDWADEVHALSSSRKREVQIEKARWKDFFFDFHRTAIQLLRKSAVPIGSGKRGDKSQHHIKRSLSEEENAALTAQAATNRISVVDLLSAASALAVDQWNKARGVVSGFLSLTVTVNARGRFQGFQTPNNSSAIFIGSLPSERKDTAAFARSLALGRIKQFRKQLDLKLMRNIEKTVNALRIFPFGIRRRIMHFVVNMHRYSAGITQVGIVWPKMVNGKPTADTNVTKAAALTVAEVHGIAYKLHSSTHLLLVAYGFRNHLHLVLACSGSLFTRAEAQSFMDLIMENLRSGVLTQRGTSATLPADETS